MSFCRWSTDNFRCDLYVYEGADSYVVHVAGSRIVTPIVPSPFAWWIVVHTQGGEKAANRWWRRVLFRLQDRLHHWSIQYGWCRPIANMNAGESFYLETPEELLALLLSLRSQGFRFPTRVLDAVRDEMEVR